MVKKPSQQAAKMNVTPEQAAALADKWADKPYGQDKPIAPPATEQQSRTTISLPESLLRQVEDLALQNKRHGREPKSVSAIVREALGLYL